MHITYTTKESTEPFSLQDKVACLVLGHYHVEQCRCSMVHDNLFQGDSGSVILRDMVRWIYTYVHSNTI